MEAVYFAHKHILHSTTNATLHWRKAREPCSCMHVPAFCLLQWAYIFAITKRQWYNIYEWAIKRLACFVGGVYSTSMSIKRIVMAATHLCFITPIAIRNWLVSFRKWCWCQPRRRRRAPRRHAIPRWSKSPSHYLPRRKKNTSEKPS